MTKHKAKQLLENATPAERKETKLYMALMRAFGFRQQRGINAWITARNCWHAFPNIRALNDHFAAKRVPRVRPQTYHIVSALMDVDAPTGSPLLVSHRY